MNKYALLLVVLNSVLGSLSANAQSGADALLNSLGKSSMNSPASQALNPSIQGEIRLDNPVARLLFNDWSSQRGLSYETNAWVQQFFAGKFETFAHLKTAMASSVDQIQSANFRNSINAAYVYSLYRLDLAQSFMNEWLKAMDNTSFASSPAAFSLDEAVSSIIPMDQWLVDQKIQLTAEQEAIIRKTGMSRHPAWLSLHAMILQRKGMAAEEILSKLGVNSPFRPKLAMTVALAYAKKNDLGNAAKILKIYYEPWMNQSKDPTARSRYSLEIARLLYQIGSVDGAIQYYQKIPKGSADYITAREELSWCWLRQGNIAELRGNLATLNSSVMSDQFRPESSLVKAISDLKICNYSQVEKDFDVFVKSNKEWAKKIEAAIQAPESATPRIVDDFSQYAMDSVKARAVEITKLQELANRSVSAALPAVGQQKHWLAAIRNLNQAMEFGKKRQSEEFRRQWKSDKLTLQESIRKMQFVKIELLSQVSQVESLTSKQEAPKEIMQAAKNKINEQGDHSFPFDGVIWPDELFKLRALTDGQCAGKL